MLQRIAYFLIVLCLSIYVLVIGKTYLVPLVLALLVWYIIRAIRTSLQRFKFFRQKVPVGLQNLFVFLMIFWILSFLGNLLASETQTISSHIPLYQENIRSLLTNLSERLNIDILHFISEEIQNIHLGNIAEPLFQALSSIFGNGFLVLIYCIFLLLEESIFTLKLNRILNSSDRKDQISNTMNKIDQAFRSYISLKTLVSFATAALSYFVLLAFHVDAALLWSILIFFLNYIPNIGSPIATLFPFLISIMQTGEWFPAVWILILIGIIQLAVGNFVEPRLMGNSLNISPFIVLVSLVVWGAIWGITGMVLSVPITVMLIIVLAQFKVTETVAILLTGNGDISNYK